MASVGVVLCVLAILAMTSGQGAINQQLLKLYNQQKGKSQGTTTPPKNQQKATTRGTTTPPRPVYSNELPASPRIIGGSRVFDRCQAPYNSMVALQLFANDPALKLTFCSGVMIAPDLILTAAICTYPYLYFDSTVFTVLVGEKSFDVMDTYQIDFNVNANNFRVHPDYDNVNGDNNIALIKLPQPVPLNACVQPLARYNDNALGCSRSLMNCTITGWGAGDIENDLTKNTKFPLYASISVASEALSRALQGVYPNRYLPENSLFGITGPNVWACLLDWGGMAACNTGGKWQLHGVIGESNCLPFNSSNPLVLTNVGSFDAWISDCTYSWAACPTIR